MKLHYESVSDALMSYLHTIMDSGIFGGFRLVGGTSLSLQRGHRRSIDIDLFTDVEYGQMPIREIKDFFERTFVVHDGSESLTESALGYAGNFFSSERLIYKHHTYEKQSLCCIGHSHADL